MASARADQDLPKQKFWCGASKTKFIMSTFVQLIETKIDNFANLLRPHKLCNSGELGLEGVRQKQNINVKNARHMKEKARHDIDGLTHRCQS